MDIPIGYTLRFLPGSEIPDDYMELDGRTISVDEHPDLCRALVQSTGDMRYRIDDTHFRLPTWNMQAVWPGSRFAIRAKNPNVVEEPWAELIPNPLLDEEPEKAFIPL